MMPSGAVVVARQAGTAAAFAPLVLAGGEVRVFAYPGAVAILERLGVTHAPVDRFDSVAAVLDAVPCPLLLTGTSLDVADDSRWWQWARRRSVPSVAFVDQWCNYAERFTVDGALLAPDALPERIAVVDPLAAARLVEAGLPAAGIVVTGTPLTDTWDAPDPVAVAALRATLGGTGNPWILLYVCEPDPSYWTDGSRLADADYDGRIALVARAAATLAADTARPVHLAIKPHPIQIQRGFRPALPAAVPGVTVSVEEGDPRGLVRSADVTIGHQSMLLHEAAVAGSAVISLLGAEETVPDLLRATPALRVCRPTDLCEGVRAAASVRAVRAHRPPRGQAANKFLDALGLAEVGA